MADNDREVEISILTAVRGLIAVLAEETNARNFARLFAYNYLNLGIHLNAVCIIF